MITTLNVQNCQEPASVERLVLHRNPGHNVKTTLIKTIVKVKVKGGREGGREGRGGVTGIYSNIIQLHHII